MSGHHNRVNAAQKFEVSLESEHYDATAMPVALTTFSHPVDVLSVGPRKTVVVAPLSAARGIEDPAPQLSG